MWGSRPRRVSQQVFDRPSPNINDPSFTIYHSSFFIKPPQGLLRNERTLRHSPITPSAPRTETRRRFEKETIVYLGLALVHADLNTCCDTLRGRTRTTCVDALRAICCDPSGVITPSLKG